MAVQLWLVRHGETEWSLDGRHTSTTDIPLTERGRERAQVLRDYLAQTTFAAVLVSPLKRAVETCEIAGLSAQAVTEPNLVEWNYGDMEGKSTAQIRTELNDPAWNVWRDGVTHGESVDEVGKRCDAVIARALSLGGENGRVALFAHAHVLRILAARWIGQPAVDGRLFALGTGSVSVLGWEREQKVIAHWNREFNEAAS